jgi:Cu/Ag efflux protein CusF
MKALHAFLLAGLLGALATCSGCNKDGATQAGKGATAERLYNFMGKVVAMDAAKPAITLDHEDIPGLMKAMEMEFPVQDAKLLDGLKVGDAVQGTVKKTESGGHLITHIEKR